jgi:hypothetical protein
MKLPKTKVIFRKFPDGEIIAMFPEVAWNDDRDTCCSYLHLGQHGAASYRLIGDTEPVTKKEYAPLYRELTKQVGYHLTIRKRIVKKWHQVANNTNM